MPDNADGVDPTAVHDCERCYARATTYLRDVQLVGFTEGKHPQTGELAYFTRWDYDGPVRFFCKRHARKARVFRNPDVLRLFAEMYPKQVLTEAEARAAERSGARPHTAPFKFPSTS